MHAAQVPLLEGISLELAPGELVALTGPSGSGKTTLLRAIAGLIDPAKGQVLLRGHTPPHYGWSAYRRQVVLVQQRPILIEGTVEENLRLPFSYKVSRTPYPEQRARELLEQLGVGAQRLDQNASSLSLGQQQRVSLIRAMLVEPTVLLLDEPTSALDPDSVALVEQFVREETTRRQMGALIVTHLRERASLWCDRIFELDPYVVSSTRKENP